MMIKRKHAVTDMKYQITATLGPGSQQADQWQKMLDEGVSGFRLNTSHLSADQLEGWMSRLEPFLEQSRDSQPRLVLDLQGSKWRLGEFSPFELQAGQVVELHEGASAHQSGVLPVPHADFFQAAAASGQEIVLNDAKVRLALESSSEGMVRARVLVGGPISPRKGITYAGSDYRIEHLSEKDRGIIEQTRRLPWIEYAVSYVRDAQEMQRYRSLVGVGVHLAAKLERKRALGEAQAIAAYADELWLCRGDLGAELGLKPMAEAVAAFHELVPSIDRPVLMAGQVLEHMTCQPAPTRSEVCYLYDILQRGYAGFVLSDETAVGQFPLESCRAAAMFLIRSL